MIRCKRFSKISDEYLREAVSNGRLSLQSLDGNTAGNVSGRTDGRHWKFLRRYWEPWQQVYFAVSSRPSRKERERQALKAG